jgi:hypothetical protein
MADDPDVSGLRGVEIAAKVAAAVGYDVQCYGGTGESLSPGSIDQDTAVALLYLDIDLEVPVFEAVFQSNRSISVRLGARARMPDGFSG